MKRNYYEYYHALKLFEGIPLVITRAHHQVLQYWIDSGLRDSELLHIDAHDDLGDDVLLSLTENENEERCLNICNFICPAVYLGVVSSIYWLNPHSTTRRLQDIGTRNREFDRPRLSTELENGKIILWDDGLERLFEKKGTNIDQLKLDQKRPYILDVDLDAFCCIEHSADNIDLFHDSINGYEGRIEETIALLNTLDRRPDLVTVTRSQAYGHRWTNPFVPSKLVDDVQSLFLEQLEQLYK